MSAFYIVTGATRGFGKAICAAVLKEGRSHVVGVARSPATLEHPNYTHVRLDLADLKQMTAPQALAPVFDPVASEFSRLVLINSAGQLETAYIGRSNPEKLASMMVVNMIAPALLCNGFVQRFQGSPGNRMVLNISSGAAANNYDGWAGYGASKAALDRFSRVLQMEQDVHRTGIRVFCVHPTIMKTDMQMELQACTEDHYFVRHQAAQSRRKSTMSTPEQMARRVLTVVQHPERFPDVVVDSRTLLALA